MTTTEEKKVNLVTELQEIIRKVNEYKDYSLEETERDIRKVLSNIYKGGF